MDEQVRLRQFYVRFLLVAGILWSGMPFLTAPLTDSGPAHSRIAVATAIFASLSLLLACIVGFWHRRTACVWLTFDALVLVAAMADSAKSRAPFGSYLITGIAISILLALCLDWMEFRRWPGALEKLAENHSPIGR